MSINGYDEHQETIMAIFRENNKPLDSDLILTLGTNFMLCASPEKLIFQLREERPPEDVISVYVYLKSIELSRMMIFGQKTYSEDYDNFRLKTILGLLALSPVIQDISKKTFDEVEFHNAIERLEFYQEAASELSEMDFSIYIRRAIQSNPNLLSLRTYYLVSMLTYQHLSLMKRKEYRLFREMQQNILEWRQKYLE